ncbi:ABC transporter permease [Paenibacillus rhizovicinus]|uniref:ABC transporter permease n=2 Tax=Paenibacillus rhizovicinus TaxID=2704463 RepID=A0A6C0P914_9BACL|nr:ABC transporter permease [Paenibacillus rhizovicinus]
MTVQDAERMTRLRGLPRIRTELNILFKIQFAMIRDSWVFVVLMATMFPLTNVLFMSIFVPDPSEKMMVQIIAGNMIFGVIFMGLNGLAQDISWQKHQEHFTFYASLPISKLNFVAANLMRGLMNTLPSLVILGVIGKYLFHIDLQLTWGLPIVILLSLASIVGIGTLLGFWSPNHNLTNILGQTAMMLVTFLTPVMVEADRFPPVMQWISYLLPTTYAADAMRIVLFKGWTGAVLLDCIVLLGFTLVTLVLVNRMVSWRVK